MIQPVGYLKLWREMATKPIWLKSTPEQKTILITLMMMVNFKPNKWEWKGEQFEVKAGQVITSLESIVENCGKGITTQNVRTALNRFEKLGFLTNESTKTGRLITVENWEVYQCDEESQQSYQQTANKDLTNSQQRLNKQLTPIEERKEGDKEKEKENIIKDIVEYLNEISGKNFKHNSNKTKSCINARLKEGFTFENFKTVINLKVSQWKDDVKMSTYIRPETLFGTKFEGYLNESPKIVSAGDKRIGVPPCESILPERDDNPWF